MAVFAYPESTQYGELDVVSGQIVRAYERRNWQLPGMTPFFHEYPAGDTRVRYLQRLHSKYFRLIFGRAQSMITSLVRNSVGIVTIQQPGKELTLDEDAAALMLKIYVGDNWARDEQLFYDDCKQDARLKLQPRFYQTYVGSIRLDREEIYPRMLPQFLIPYEYHDDEYRHQPGEPEYFLTHVEIKSFARWLRDFVLKPIEAK
ncbi:MAG: hypothetical protein M3Q81_01405 [bacterium]|nr:hypothetical protein [bacterium]